MRIVNVAATVLTPLAVVHVPRQVEEVAGNCCPRDFR